MARLPPEAEPGFICAWLVELIIKKEKHVPPANSTKQGGNAFCGGKLHLSPFPDEFNERTKRGRTFEGKNQEAVYGDVEYP